MPDELKILVNERMANQDTRLDQLIGRQDETDRRLNEIERLLHIGVTERRDLTQDVEWLKKTVG